MTVSLPPPGPARDRAVALLLALLAAAFRLPRLGFPGEEVFDEVYHAKTALQYLQSVNPTEWVHPPTAKLLIAVFVWIFGYDAWSWRLAPALAGIALAPVFYMLARRVLETDRSAVLATLLLLADGVYLVQSRTAMTNIFAVLFQVATALFVVRAVLHERLPVREMAFAGLFLGLALSTRWTSLWAIAFLGLVVLVVRGRRIFTPREILLVGMTFAAIPLALYVVSYVPWMRQVDPWTKRLLELPEHTYAIWRYHSDLRAEHPYFSAWYTWPWLYRPTWYYFNQDAANNVRGIVAIGNPGLWWVSVPVALWALVTGIRAKDPRRIFAGAGFACLYLPWGISPRTLNYSHYLFEAIPYTCLALGILLDRHWSDEHRALSRGYLALTWVLFLFFYPFLAATPVPASWYYHDIYKTGVRPWTWFRTWV